MGRLSGWEVEDDFNQAKKKPSTGSKIKTIAEIVVEVIDALQDGGLISKKKEGYDPKRDMPRDKDTGEDLF